MEQEGHPSVINKHTKTTTLLFIILWLSVKCLQLSYEYEPAFSCSCKAYQAQSKTGQEYFLSFSISSFSISSSTQSTINGKIPSKSLPLWVDAMFVITVFFAVSVVVRNILREIR